MDGIKIVTAEKLRAMTSEAILFKRSQWYKIQTELIYAASCGNNSITINYNLTDCVVELLKRIGCIVEGHISEDTPVEERPDIKEISIKIKW